MLAMCYRGEGLSDFGCFDLKGVCGLFARQAASGTSSARCGPLQTAVAPAQSTMEIPSPEPQLSAASQVSQGRRVHGEIAQPALSRPEVLTKTAGLPGSAGSAGSSGSTRSEVWSQEGSPVAELASATSRLASATAALQVQLGVPRREDPKEVRSTECVVDESEPDAEALAMPERTVRLEREVAELREDVRRIEHTVSSFQIEPEQEDRIEDNLTEGLWTDSVTSKIKPDNVDLVKPEKEKEEREEREEKVKDEDAKECNEAKATSVGPPVPPASPASPTGKGKGKAKGGPKGAPKGGPPKGSGKGGPPPAKGGPPPKNPGGPPGSKIAPKAESKAPFHKRLYWKQVDIADAEGTIFSEDSRKRANTCSAIDFNALSKILEAEKTKGSQLQRRSSGVLSKAQMRSVGTKVLSDHRARNIAIVLKRMPTSTTELVSVLSTLRWEDSRISSDDLEQILDAVPTHEEAKRLREHSSPEACQKLRDVEQMVMPLTLLSRASARVRVLCIARNVRLQFKSNMRTLARIRAACWAIQKSGMLRNVMLLALQLGNFINHGDSNKGAKAIAISSLLALRDFKCGEGISTLHFLCASLMRSGQSDAAQVLLREHEPQKFFRKSRREALAKVGNVRLQPAERIAKLQAQDT